MTRVGARSLAFDVVGVLVFVAIGRRSHEETSALAGLASTAWPFLVGLLVGWSVLRAWRHPARTTPEGVGIWLSTVVVGMALRVLAGQGTAVSFIVVTQVVLGLFLLGRRALLPVLTRRLAHR